MINKQPLTPCESKTAPSDWVQQISCLWVYVGGDCHRTKTFTTLHGMCTITRYRRCIHTVGLFLRTRRWSTHTLYARVTFASPKDLQSKMHALKLTVWISKKHYLPNMFTSYLKTHSMGPLQELNANGHRNLWNTFGGNRFMLVLQYVRVCTSEVPTGS